MPESASGAVARRNILDMPSTPVRAGETYNMVYRAEGTLSRILLHAWPPNYVQAIMDTVHHEGLGASVFVVGTVSIVGEGYGCTVKVKNNTQGHTVDGVFSPLKSFSGLTLMSVTPANLGTRAPATAADATAAVAGDFPPRDTLGLRTTLGGVGSTISNAFSKVTLLAIVLVVLVGLVMLGPELKAGLGRVTK
jgi:hypothetical protein